MGLRDQIFPPGPPVDGNIIRTAWVGTWESRLLGLGRLTKLQPLMGAAKGAVKSAGLVAPWDRFEGAQAEYIGLVDEIDEGAATF
jgi:hypothetical protein